MTVRIRAVLFLAGWLGAATAGNAQVPQGAVRDSVARGLDALTARLDSLETGQCPAGQPVVAPARTGEARTDSLVATLEALSRRLETLRAARCQPGAAPAAAPSPGAPSAGAPSAGAPSPGAPSPASPGAPATADTTDELAALRAAAAQAAGAPAPPPAAGGAEPAPRDTTPKETEFVGKQRNASALNPEISATGDIRLV
ncbi:MAG TPA: hypothetical protein VHR43_11290, partial [Gemmatimonadales bacterium]|nr:hypothetical protein [Gemmatimonadales bacterium]